MLSLENSSKSILISIITYLFIFYYYSIRLHARSSPMEVGRENLVPNIGHDQIGWSVGEVKNLWNLSSYPCICLCREHRPPNIMILAYMHAFLIFVSHKSTLCSPSLEDTTYSLMSVASFSTIELKQYRYYSKAILPSCNQISYEHSSTTNCDLDGYLNFN